MFSFEQIKELIKLVGESRLHALEIERAGFRLSITGEAPRPQEMIAPAASAVNAIPASLPTAAVPLGATPVDRPEAAMPPAAAPAADLHVVASPIVGTFYAAPAPDADPFIRVGDRVRKGQVLCIVEAMKLMNEIESDADGVVGEIYPQNAQPVEYGEPLFGIRAD